LDVAPVFRPIVYKTAGVKAGKKADGKERFCDLLQKCLYPAAVLVSVCQRPPVPQPDRRNGGKQKARCSGPFGMKLWTVPGRVSERDIVIGKVIHRWCRLLRCRSRTLRPLAIAAALVLAAVAALLARSGLPLRALAAEIAATTAFTTATEHLHLVGDDVGGVLFHTVLSGVFVVAQLTFDIDLRTLAQILAGDLAELA